MNLTYSEFHSYVGTIAVHLRRDSFIPKYIVAQREGLIAAAFLARRFSFSPIVLDFMEVRTGSVQGNVLVVTTVSNAFEANMYETLRQVFGQYSNVKLRTAALVECSFPVDYSAMQLPEEPGMPWQV